MVIRLQSCNKKAFLIAKLKIIILYCLCLILKILILILNYQKSNVYNNKKSLHPYLFIYKGLMQRFVVQSVLCERLCYALLFRHSFLFVTCAEERRVGISERFVSDISFALCVNIAYAFFEARRESQPPSGVGIS